MSQREKNTLFWWEGQYCLNMIGVITFTLFFYLLGFSQTKGIQTKKTPYDMTEVNNGS